MLKRILALSIVGALVGTSVSANEFFHLDFDYVGDYEGVYVDWENIPHTTIELDRSELGEGIRSINYIIDQSLGAVWLEDIAYFNKRVYDLADEHPSGGWHCYKLTPATGLIMSLHFYNETGECFLVREPIFTICFACGDGLYALTINRPGCGLIH